MNLDRDEKRAVVQQPADFDHDIGVDVFWAFPHGRDLGPEAGAMWMIRRCGPGDGNGPGPAR